MQNEESFITAHVSSDHLGAKVQLDCSKSFTLARFLLEMRTRAGRARARSRSSAGEERGAAPDVARASFDGDFSSGWPSEANELRRPTPYPFSVFALDNSFPEETKEEAMLECEREFRQYYTLAQAPQIKAFINLGMIMALVRLAKPALDAASGSWDSVPWLCKIGHIVENVALTALCAFVRLFGFKRSAGRTMPPSTVWWHLVYFILTMFAWLVRARAHERTSFLP